jgi:hypothetical protein
MILAFDREKEIIGTRKCNRLGDHFTHFFPSSPTFSRENGDDNGRIEMITTEWG